MELQGKIKVIGTTMEVGSSGFRKRELVITTDEQYPQHIAIEFVQDKTALLDNHKIGEDVKVSINVRGREWINPQGESKYFNSLNGWRIEASTPAQTSPPPFEPAPPLENAPDDLPF
jgi:hypothetical protein